MYTDFASTCSYSAYSSKKTCTEFRLSEPNRGTLNEICELSLQRCDHLKDVMTRNSTGLPLKGAQFHCAYNRMIVKTDNSTKAVLSLIRL